MTLYRVDKRDFKIGAEISSANEFASLNPAGSNEAEEIFELHRPSNKPNRIGCLYLFENEEVAKKHWSKMSDGILYEVKLHNEPILHRGDMRLIDEAFMSSDDYQKEMCAKNYWSGFETSNPRIEILVKKAIVVCVISKDQTERVEYFKSWAL